MLLITVHYIFNILEISRKTVEKKVWFSHQVLSVSKTKKLTYVKRF